MIADTVKFRGHRCFKKDWSGFDAIKPINVIIGRNNSGKSHLLDLVTVLCAQTIQQSGHQLNCEGVLDEQSLIPYFSRQQRGGALQGHHWEDHGRHLMGRKVTWLANVPNHHCIPVHTDGTPITSSFGNGSTQVLIQIISQILQGAKHALSGTTFMRLLADRDIRPEPPSAQLHLAANGQGATNIIRRYIHTSNETYPRELVQRELLGALNKIFGQDGQFTEIQAKEHDEAGPGRPQGHWEIYLGEEKKGLIPLSSSGSGLKTVILVLLNLLIVPELQITAKNRYTFAFEELENNLHPALLRRLFQFLEEYATEHNSAIFLTTHSSVALDFFGVSKNAQIVHVAHDGESARTTTVSAHFDHLGVISELGAKPSDLLQANGIIWVEGPSDCIYLNRWIDLASGGKFQEGRDYQCAFYGGSLLARTQFASPEDAERELVNLFRVNPNIIVVCDGDRPSKGARVKDRVRRIRAEVSTIPNAHIWVTNAREIENYVPGTVLAQALNLQTLPDPEQYEMFFPRKGSPGNSYMERQMNRSSVDKMDLAILCAPKMDEAVMASRFEWKEEIKRIVETIQRWNS